MPYALCPMPYARRVPHFTEKGYSAFSLLFLRDKSVFGISRPSPLAERFGHSHSLKAGL
jgi:hypothetical protein